MNFNFTKAYAHQTNRLLKLMMKTFIFFFCVTIFSFTPKTGFPQKAKITIEANANISIQEVFKLIASQTNYNFIFSDNLIKEEPKIYLNKGIIDAETLLNKSLTPIFCTYEFSNNTVIVKKIEQEVMLVRGTIRDNKGEPIPGVTVLYKESKNKGTSSDFNGNYKILVNKYKKATLQFSAIGYSTQIVSVNNRKSIDIVMQESSEYLDEVVLVGYGEIAKEKLTGAVTKITPKIIQTTQNVSYADALIGVVPGLLVQESYANPDTPPTILLRGVGSINASTQPLIIIDGIQMPGLTSLPLNNNDIDSISILKDASATAIYGSRGSNGVILITTKRGEKNNNPNVTFSTRFGIKAADTSFKSKIMSASQKLDYEESLGFYTNNQPLLDKRRNSGNNVDWSDLLIKDEISKNHDISISGGGEKSSYYSSISYTDVENIFGSNYKRYTAIMRADFDLNKKISLALSGNFANVNNKDRRNIGDPFSNAFLLNPWEKVYDEFGNPLNKLTFTNNSNIPFNPIFIRNNTDINSTRNNIGGSAKVTYKPLEWLKLNGTLGLNYNTEKGSEYEKIIVKGGILDYSTSNSNNYTATLTATIDKKIDQHNFNLTLGNEFNETESGSFSASAKNFQSDAIQTLNAALDPVSVSVDSRTHAGSISYFSRLNYSFKNTYNISLSYRRDGSSRFGNNNKYANFAAVGASWNIHNNLLKDNKNISTLKLRFSNGTTGNDFIGNFTSRSLYRYRYRYNGNSVPNLSRGSNPNLTWEKNKSTNIALDFGFFNDHITGSFDYYIRTTKDLLNNVPIPLTSGFQNVTSNIGEFENRGIEVLLHSTNINNSNFNWTTDITFSYNKGTVISLTEDRKLIRIGNITYKEGSPINALYLANWVGVNPKTGFNQYRNSNGDYIDYNTDPSSGNRNEISDLREVSNKTSIPKYHGGITNTLNYKSFDASFLVSFSGGNYVLNDGLYNLYNKVNLNQHVNVLKAWKKEGDVTDIAVRAINSFTPNSPIDSDFQNSSQFMQDASYIKLKNIVLGYSLSDELTSKLGIDKLRFFIQGQNLYTISDVDFIDPEYATGAGGIGLSSSIRRGFSFGVNVNF